MDGQGHRVRSLLVGSDRAAGPGCTSMHEAPAVDLLRGGLVLEVLHQLPPAPVQVLQVALLRVVLLGEVVVRLQQRAVVLVELGAHGVRDVLRGCAALAPVVADVGHGHGLLQGVEMEAGLGHGAVGVVDVRVGLLDLLLQAHPGHLGLRDALLRRAVRPHLGLLGPRGAAVDELRVLVPERRGRVLARRGAAVQGGGLELAQLLVLAALQLRSAVRASHPRDRARRWTGSTQRHRKEAGLRSGKAHLVDAQGVHLVLQVVAHVPELPPQVRDGGLGALGGVAQLPLDGDQRAPLLLQRDLCGITHLLARWPPRALLQAPEAELQWRILGPGGALQVREGLAGELDRILQTLSTIFQLRNEVLRVSHFLFHAVVQLVVHLMVIVHRLAVYPLRLLALVHCVLMGTLCLHHVNLRPLSPLVCRQHAAEGSGSH
mmetsp:Transcript_114855/g.335941  ORF Transcript_114855/g.335941 Transcript_114855/m.335941 type:complete len:432 (-) Transcript_114855:62-1357(-)